MILPLVINSILVKQLKNKKLFYRTSKIYGRSLFAFFFKSSLVFSFLNKHIVSITMNKTNERFNLSFGE